MYLGTRCFFEFSYGIISQLRIRYIGHPRFRPTQNDINNCSDLKMMPNGHARDVAMTMKLAQVNNNSR